MPVLKEGPELVTTVPTTSRERIGDLLMTIGKGQSPVYTDAGTDPNKRAFDQMAQDIAFMVRDIPLEALKKIKYPNEVRGVKAQGIFAGFYLAPQTHRADPGTYDIIRNIWLPLPEEIRLKLALDIANRIAEVETLDGDSPFERNWYRTTGNSCFGVALGLLLDRDSYQPDDEWANVVRNVLTEYELIDPRRALPAKI